MLPHVPHENRCCNSRRIARGWSLAELSCQADLSHNREAMSSQRHHQVKAKSFDMSPCHVNRHVSNNATTPAMSASWVQIFKNYILILEFLEIIVLAQFLWFSYFYPRKENNQQFSIDLDATVNSFFLIQLRVLIKPLCNKIFNGIIIIRSYSLAHYIGIPRSKNQEHRNMVVEA